MSKTLTAAASTRINAPRERVWQALTDPEAVPHYMFGARVISDWKEGSPIIWKGEWQGKPFEDKGTILQFKPGLRLSYSHFSPLLGVPDQPENYHTVTIELSDEGNQTRLSLTQDNNGDEAERLDSEQNWGRMLNALKKYVEG